MKRFTRFSVNTRNCQVGKQSVIKRNILRNWKIIIYCPLLQTTVLFAMPLKAAAKPSALRGQYERRLLVAKPPPAIHCRYCKIVDFAIEPSIILLVIWNKSFFQYYLFLLIYLYIQLVYLFQLYLKIVCQIYILLNNNR